jgi:tRNA threonylcarbamoyl adenosine modification protein (Sua5/YciO/YrdC/YwlC family)
VIDLAIEDSVAWIAGGGVLAYPTETVWGLGADACSDTAVAQLRAFKGRAGDAPISILVTDLDALEALGFRVDAAAERLARDFWPGPLTLVLPCRGRFAATLARADGAVGVRCSPHPVASELAARCARAGAGPLTATSCNASGAPAARTRDAARRACGEVAGVRLLAGGADAGGEAASTVVDVTGPRPRVLRWGALAARELSPVLEELAA